MTSKTLHRVLAGTVAVAVAGGLYWFVDAPLLAAVAGACWGVGAAILFRVSRLYPSRGTGSGWRDSRWTGLSVGLTTAAALLGVSPYLGIADDLRLALAMLVIGVGFVGYAAGSMAEMEREAVESDDGDDPSQASGTASDTGVEPASG